MHSALATVVARTGAAPNVARDFGESTDRRAGAVVMKTFIATTTTFGVVCDTDEVATAAAEGLQGVLVAVAIGPELQGLDDVEGVPSACQTDERHAA